MDELELKLKSRIDHMLCIGPLTPFDAGFYGSSGFIRVVVFNTEGENKVEHKVQFFCPDPFHLRTIIWRRANQNDDWGMPIYENDPKRIPKTEEEYFQYSTVDAMDFSLEFYEYLVGVLTNQ